MKKLVLAVLASLCLAVPASAQVIDNVPLLSLQRLTGAVGFDYVYVIDDVLPEKWEPKLGAILAYKLLPSLNVGVQAWINVEDINKPKELRAVVRWRAF